MPEGQMLEDDLPIAEITRILERIWAELSEEKSFRARVLIEMLFIEVIWIQKANSDSENDLSQKASINNLSAT
ncbi:hypothetical protein [Methylobacterium thuringiense]|uniref:hypothetical protein n=1 Tax=Methylobacterium thuringiense TaxID=1003091 RepID=UPI001EDDD788|nr:hypothetical protein [Methylobacterium thuringiense]